MGSYIFLVKGMRRLKNEIDLYRLRVFKEHICWGILKTENDIKDRLIFPARRIQGDRLETRRQTIWLDGTVQKLNAPHVSTLFERPSIFSTLCDASFARHQ
jgi:hypothetical protein